MSPYAQPVYLSLPSDMIGSGEVTSHYYSKCGGYPIFPNCNFSSYGIKFESSSPEDSKFTSELSNFLVCGVCQKTLSLVSQVYAPLTEKELGDSSIFSNNNNSSAPSPISERLIMLFGCTTPRCGRNSGSWRALRVQIVHPNTIEPNLGSGDLDPNPPLDDLHDSSKELKPKSVDDDNEGDTSSILTSSKKAPAEWGMGEEFGMFGSEADFGTVADFGSGAGEMRGFEGGGYSGGYGCLPEELNFGDECSIDDVMDSLGKSSSKPIANSSGSPKIDREALTDWSSLSATLEAAQVALHQKQGQRSQKTTSKVQESTSQQHSSYSQSASHSSSISPVIKSIPVVLNSNHLPGFYVAEELEENLIANGGSEENASGGGGKDKKKRESQCSEAKIRNILSKYAAEDENLVAILQQSDILAEQRKKRQRKDGYGDIGGDGTGRDGSSSSDDDNDAVDGNEEHYIVERSEDGEDDNTEDEEEEVSRGAGKNRKSNLKKKGNMERERNKREGLGGGSDDNLENMGWENEKYEMDKVRGMIPSAVKFWKTLARVQEQCVRYQFRGINRWPLVQRPRPSSCPRCGKARRFELQLMPAMMSSVLSCSEYLDENDIQEYKQAINAAANWDFATIAVFSCENSCAKGLKNSDDKLLNTSIVVNDSNLFIAEEEVFIVNEDECHVKF